MKFKRMGITEILRRIWLFSANKIKSSESFIKQPTQLIIELNLSLRQIIVTIVGGLMGRSEKVDVIYEWSLTRMYYFNNNIAMSTLHSLL